MMNVFRFGDVNKNDVNRIPQFKLSDVNILWVDDFYDGFISGIARYQETMLRFDLIDYEQLSAETEKTRRKYWLIILNDAQLEEERYWHELFCLNVGSHYDFTNNYLPLAEPDINLDAFYIPYSKRVIPDYRDNRIIGWFEN
jgi:hypothetical protein